MTEMIIPISPMYSKVMEKWKETNYLESDEGMKELLSMKVLYANNYDKDRCRSMRDYCEISIADRIGAIVDINPDDMTITVSGMGLVSNDLGEVEAVPRVLSKPDLSQMKIITFDIRPKYTSYK